MSMFSSRKCQRHIVTCGQAAVCCIRHACFLAISLPRWWILYLVFVNTNWSTFLAAVTYSRGVSKCPWNLSVNWLIAAEQYKYKPYHMCRATLCSFFKCILLFSRFDISSLSLLCQILYFFIIICPCPHQVVEHLNSFSSMTVSAIFTFFQSHISKKLSFVVI